MYATGGLLLAELICYMVSPNIIVQWDAKGKGSESDLLCSHDLPHHWMDGAANYPSIPSGIYDLSDFHTNCCPLELFYNLLHQQHAVINMANNKLPKLLVVQEHFNRSCSSQNTTLYDKHWTWHCFWKETWLI